MKRFKKILGWTVIIILISFFSALVMAMFYQLAGIKGIGFFFGFIFGIFLVIKLLIWCEIIIIHK